MSGARTGPVLFHELRKQASSFLRTARLALTDVTPAQLLTEEATNGSNSSSPDARTMGVISRAAFDPNDYFRIVQVLHKRLSKFDKKLWREPYKALMLLEHLLTHGPESIAEEFTGDVEVIREMAALQYIDEKGFNWGLAVEKKSDKVLQMLEDAQLLKEERERARKVAHEIQGFGSFNLINLSPSRNYQKHLSCSYGRSNSHYEVCSVREEYHESDDQKEGFDSDVSGNWKAEFGGFCTARKVPMEESEPFLPHEEEKTANGSETSPNSDTQMDKKSEFRDWISNGSKEVSIDESEPFLPHKDDDRTNELDKSLNSSVHFDKKSEFSNWVWASKGFLSDKGMMLEDEKTISPTNEAALIEDSEPFLPCEEEEMIIGLENVDHPFNFEHQKRESFLLLRQV